MTIQGVLNASKEQFVVASCFILEPFLERTNTCNSLLMTDTAKV